MLTLLSECHLWTTRSEIRIKPSDFGSFKYFTKKEFDNKCILSTGKKDYHEKRDGIVLLSNRKPARLKDNLRKLEDLLKLHKIVHAEWKDLSIVQILLSNGILVHISINVFSGDIQKMAYDKYFVGKLASDMITDAVFTRQHIILAYNTNQVTVVFLQKPNMRRYGPEKISNMDPKIFHVLIPGPSERKLARHLVVNSSFDLVIIWTKSSQNEVYPWRPTIRDQDRANVHVYKLRSAKLESVAYCWTENDPICVEFLRASEGQILTVEQKVSRKGEITAEICSYDVNHTKLQRVAVTSIPVGTQICCHSFSPDQEKLLLGTIDKYVCLYDMIKKVTKFAPKTDIIPTLCAWHPDSGIIMIANDRSQFQCFDISLSFVANQLTSEDVTPSNLLDLSHYFSLQPTLLNISFSNKPDLNSFIEAHAQTDCYLLLLFENGPLGALRFFSGAGLMGDIHNSGLTADVLVNKYLAINQLEKAVNMLLSLNWETYGAMCLISLHKISNYIFTRNEAKRSRNELLNRALRSFIADLSEETKDEFEDQVMDIKRRFFFFLLRHKLYTDAFEIARDVQDYDLFMDIFNVTKSDANYYDLCQESYKQAELILNQTAESAIGDNSCAGDSFSSCSFSSCSECVSHSRTNTKHNSSEVRKPEQSLVSTPASQFLVVKRSQKNLTDSGSDGGKFKNYVPPLPYFKSPVFNAENIKINIPKPELKVDGIGNGFRATKARSCDFRQYLDKNSVDNHTTSNHFVNKFRTSHSSNLVPPGHNKSINNHHGTNNILSSSSHHLPDHQISSWSQIPDQTVGIPIANQVRTSSTLPTSSHNFVQRTVSSSYLSSLTYNQQVPLHDFVPNNNITFANDDNSHLLKFYQHPLVSGNIPATNTPLYTSDEGNYRTRKPATSILSNSTNNLTNGQSINSSAVPGYNSQGKKDPGERNKVKFSDTVQVAVVPEIPRKEKPLPPKRNGFRPLLTDPQKELADSLPLCHPNDDYLKDFNPITEVNATSPKAEAEEEDSNKNPPTIKVVHFGVV